MPDEKFCDRKCLEQRAVLHPQWGGQGNGKSVEHLASYQEDYLLWSYISSGCLLLKAVDEAEGKDTIHTWEKM